MRERQIYQVGTMRVNKMGAMKKFAFKKQSATIPRGTYKIFKSEDNELRYITWMDRKPVNFLSAIPSKATTCCRRSHTGTATVVTCPTIVCLYNEAMGGTDSFDQRMSYYWPHIRSAKWTVRVLIHFLFVAQLNAHILFKCHFKLLRGQSGFTFLDFSSTLLRQLCTDPEVPITRVGHVPRSVQPASVTPVRITGQHFPLRVSKLPMEESTCGRAVERKRRCQVCGQRTAYYCAVCNAGLHIGQTEELSCWSIFHSKAYHP